MPNQFSGPIPGQSLTGQPGGAPWEQPPQHTDLSEFLEMLFDKLTDKRQAARIAVMLKAGLTVEEVAKVTIYSSFTAGSINPDIALLAIRPTIYMIVAIAHELGIKNPKIMLPDQSQKDFMSNFVGMVGSEPETEPEASVSVDKPQFSGVLGSL